MDREEASRPTKTNRVLQITQGLFLWPLPGSCLGAHRHEGLRQLGNGEGREGCRRLLPAKTDRVLQFPTRDLHPCATNLRRGQPCLSCSQIPSRGVSPGTAMGRGQEETRTPPIHREGGGSCQRRRRGREGGGSWQWRRGGQVVGGLCQLRRGQGRPGRQICQKKGRPRAHEPFLVPPDLRPPAGEGGRHQLSCAAVGPATRSQATAQRPTGTGSSGRHGDGLPPTAFLFAKLSPPPAYSHPNPQESTGAQPARAQTATQEPEEGPHRGLYLLII